MSDYLALIVTAVVIAGALAWWLVSLRSVSKPAKPLKSEAPPKAVDAPPVAAASPPSAPKAAGKMAVTAQLMDDPKPASKNAPRKAQAPLKAAATKAAPTVAAKPAAKKPATPRATASKAAAPKTVVAKVAQPKTAAPKQKVRAKAEVEVSPKVAAASKAAPKPKAVAKPKAAPKASPKVAIPDDLGLLKGVGPKLTTLLQSLGVTKFEQVANWSAADITEIDAKLGNFAGRVGRDNWVDQAKLLASGDIAGFEKKYGALGGEIKKA